MWEKKQREVPGPGGEGRGQGPAESQAGRSCPHSTSCWGLGAQLSWSLVVWPVRLLRLLGPGLTVTLVASCHSLFSQTV